MFDANARVSATTNLPQGFWGRCEPKRAVGAPAAGTSPVEALSSVRLESAKADFAKFQRRIHSLLGAPAAGTSPAEALSSVGLKPGT
jgi:hypothetical protein